MQFSLVHGLSSAVRPTSNRTQVASPSNSDSGVQDNSRTSQPTVYPAHSGSPRAHMHAFLARQSGFSS